MEVKIYKVFSNAKQILIALAVMVTGMAYSQTSYTFNYTGGQQTLSLMPGTYSIEAWGGDGYTQVSGFNGRAGYATGILTLPSAQTINIYVGGVGSYPANAVNANTWTFNGGGIGYPAANASYGNGGGASDVRTVGGAWDNTASLASRVIVAGGGGAGRNSSYIGGNGGGLTGGTATYFSPDQTGGPTGGTQTSGGSNTGYSTGVTTATLGKAMTWDGNTMPANFLAGGGGGYWGGASGRVGGGGGSSYLGGVTSGSTFMFGQAGFITNPVASGDGRVIIRELCSILIYSSGNSTLSSAICSGQSLTLTTSAVSNYSWSTGQTTSSIVVAPTTNTVYSLVATSSLNCTTGATRSVNVSSSLPVLSISNPSNNICLGKTVSLTATGALTYTWANAGVVNGQTFTPSSTAVYTVTGQNGCGTSNATTTITVAPLPVSASATPSLVCEGYTTALSGVSAVNGYTWQPGTQTGSIITVAPTANTIYTVTASDGICSGTQTVLVSTKTTPVIVTSQTLSNICLGQNLTLSASGAGTGGTYSWSTGGTGASIVLAPATSTAIFVAGTNSLNCTASAQQVILVNQPPALAVTANKFAVCTGDPVILTASGAPIYQWTNGPATANFTVNPAVTTVYTITGSQTTNTCTIDATITINAIVPNVSVTSSVAVCIGGSVAILANGASLYKWNGGLNSTNGNYVTTPAVSSVFTLVATTSSFNVNCLTTHYASVTVNQNPTITVTPGKETICRGETHTLTANGASTYSWSGATSTGSVITVKPTSSTFYTVTGVDAKGCENTIIYNAKVNSCNGIAETIKQQFVSVYPNPNNGDFIITAASELTLRIMNSIGQEVRSVTLNNSNAFKVQVQDLSTGVYFILGESAEGKISQKIFITK